MQLQMHWGTFVKATPKAAPGTTSVRLCLELAETALRRFNFAIFDPADQTGDFAVGGIGPKPGGEVIVQVVGVPLDTINTWLIVSASSNSSTAAEQARNSIRAFIVNGG
jgi:hypothetical protein